MTITEENSKTVKADAENSLTVRAMLGGTGYGLQFILTLLLGFVLTPIIVQGLGPELYGVWSIVGQTMGYIALAGFGVTSTMKYTLATEQHSDDWHWKRQQVGASLLGLARIFPLFVGLGVIVVWFAPNIFKVSAEYVDQVRWCVAIGVLGELFDQVSAIPGNILRGLNLDYKAIWLTTFMSALISIFSAVVVLLNWGIIGLAIAAALGVVAVGGFRYFLARKYVPWLGIERPPKAVFRLYWHRSLWVFLASGSFVMQTSSELLIVGILLGPSAAAIYATTGLVMRLATGPIFSIVASANPGIARLCGEQKWELVEKARNQIHLMALVMLTVLGTGVLALNRAFIGFWLGSKFYGGNNLNLLLVVIALQSIPLRADIALMDGMLRFRERAVSTFLTSILSIIFAALLAPSYGVEGIALGIIGGRLLAQISYQFIITHGTSINSMLYFRWIFRPVLIGGGLLVVGYIISFDASSIFSFVALGGTIALSVALIMWFIGLNQEHRRVLTQRFAPHLPVVFRYLVGKA